jgi:hypothetical protein
MKEFISMMFRRNNNPQDVDCEFTITQDIPQPIRNIKPSEQMRVIETLRNLPVNGSFPIRNELEYTVRKMTGIYYPEYKIVIRNMGTSKRVFRLA